MRNLQLSIFLIILSTKLVSQSLLDNTPIWESPSLPNNYTFFNSNLVFSTSEKLKLGANVTPYRFGLDELNTTRLFIAHQISNFNLALGVYGISNKLYYEIAPTLSGNYKFDKLLIGANIGYSRMQIHSTDAFNAIKIDLAARLELDENLAAAVLLKNVNDGKFAGNSQANKSSIIGFCYEKDAFIGAIDVEIRESFGTAFVVTGGTNITETLKAKSVYKTYPQNLGVDFLYLLKSNQLIASFSLIEKLGFSSTIGYAIEF